MTKSSAMGRWRKSSWRGLDADGLREKPPSQEGSRRAQKEKSGGSDALTDLDSTQSTQDQHFSEQEGR